MQIEIKGLLAALTAGVFVVGASYGVSALVTHAQTAQTAHKAADAARAAQAPGATPQVIRASFVVQGRAFYTQSCASCHGADAQGGYGPNLHGLGDPDTRVATVIRNGVPPKMPGFGDKYQEPQVRALVAYVQSLKK